MGKLTAAKVRAITGTGLHSDGGTLYLRLTVNGRRRDIGRGGFPLVTRPPLSIHVRNSPSPKK